MAYRLPKKLNKEPLVDAVFEVRFSASAPASSILPGIFFNKLDGDKVINQLPASEIPKQIRDNDPQLHFVPVVQISWNNFLLLMGDRSVTIGCKMPYTGWFEFRKAILKIIEILGEVGTIQCINRYSLKYVDLISSSDIEEQVAVVKLDICLGDHHLKKEKFSFRTELLQEEYVNIIQIVSSAKFTSSDGKIKKEGLVLDIDTVCIVKDEKFTDFTVDLQTKLDKIHDVNKVTFFNCITPDTLDMLGPVYE
jgi:uncharacterized protein (TIGR04255 family)